MYADLLKEGRRKNNNMSMDDLVDEYKRKYNLPLTKQNYRKYESEELYPKKPDLLFLERIFTILGLDTSILPHKQSNDDGSHYKKLYEEEREKYIKAIERENALLEKLNSLLLSRSKG